MVSSQTVGRAWCPTDERWMAVVPSPLRWYHLPHVVLSILTIVWLLFWREARKPICATCGHHDLGDADADITG